MAKTTKEALWASGDDESVEVNQRALIDKVLARYSGEFSVFRELLQNADDATSKAVEIRFETKKYIDGNSSSEDHAPPLLDLKTALVHKWSLKNNGIPFRPEDWNRLKKIADGNPDEQKIGAFGVGFYSMFSATEEPFVMSGGQWMGFYWKDKKDQLFVRRGKIPDQPHDPWTTFEMDLREPTPIPNAFDFTRFLVSSITFMTHLREVSVYFDDKRLVHLTKDVGNHKQLTIPPGLTPTSAMGFMNIKGLKSAPLHINAEVMNWVYSTGTEKPKQIPVIEQIKSATGISSSPLGLGGSGAPRRAASPPPPQTVISEAGYLKVGQSSVTLTIFTAEVDVNLSEKLSAEIRRSTKKNPPSALKYEFIYTGKNEYDRSKKEDEAQPKATGSIFQGLRADLSGSGSARVFIGHATAQTTGFGGHMAARFIPTVERESIDLVDRNVAVWNKGLLFVGGFLARAVYELEMQDIKTRWDDSVASKKLGELLDSDLRREFYNRAKHNMQFFAFHPSTPSAVVSSEMRSAFFDCVVRGQPFPVVSSAGVKSALDVRMPDPALSAFLPELPVFPEELLDGCKPVVAALQEKGMLEVITFADVSKALRERPLSEEEMAACLRWWIDASQKDPTGIDDNRRVFLGAAVLTVGSPDNGDERRVPLEEIRTFLNPRRVILPTNGPFPSHLLPISVNRKLDSAQLQKYLQWKELTVLEWVEHIVNPAVCTRKREFNIVESPEWADRVLQALGQYWPTLEEVIRTTIVGLLGDLTCIPTSAGMKTPSQAYFSEADIFNDLAVVKLPSGARTEVSLEEVLADLGVRKHADLQVIFERMVETGNWTVPDLINYLVSIHSKLKPVEFEQLRDNPAFPEEATAEGNGNQDGTPKKNRKLKASELYEPLDVFRTLGLQIIDWRSKGGNKHEWRPDSKGAKFLFELGLRRHPPTEVVLGIAAKGGSRGTAALGYFLDNHRQKYADYTVAAHANTAFVPAIHKDEKKLVKPLEVFSNQSWRSLGFPVIDHNGRDAANILQIREHPPIAQLVRRLEESPPTTEKLACEWFGILSRRISDFQSSDLDKISMMCIVPTHDPGSTGPRMLPPNQCYFKGKSNHQLYSKLFVFVDFGPSANSFMNACGVRGEPSVEDIAASLMKDPRRFFELADGQDNYLGELRNIAINSRSLSSVTLDRLKKAEILVASRRVRKQKPDKAVDHVGGDEGDQDMEYILLASEQVAVVDDMIAYQQFGAAIYCAPQETILEGFYRSLGCKRLGDLVQDELRGTGETAGSDTAQQVRSLILERLPFFLEHNNAALQVTTWLKNEGNFIIRTFKKFTVTRSVKFAGVRSTVNVDTSAAARWEGKGGIELWLTDDIQQVDIYEVAASLCRLLFNTRKANDALLLMTILSSDLPTLRKRGYPVDSILQRRAPTDAPANKIDTTALASPRTAQPKPKYMPTPAPVAAADLRALRKPGYHVNRIFQQKAEGGAPIEPLSKKAGKTALFSRPKYEHSGSTNVDRSNIIPKIDSPNDGDSKGRSRLSFIDRLFSLKAPPSKVPQAPEKPTTDLVSFTDIALNIEAAIRAFDEEGNPTQSNKQSRKAKRDPNDYCGITGGIDDLTQQCEVGGVKLHLSTEIPDPTKLLEDKKDTVARFVEVVVPLRGIYELPSSSVHIFYDLVGSTVAFSCNTGIFLNLRYYEVWHDGQVKDGNFSEAYISWYFTLAHEIAHSLVQPHNAEHELYFSSICQRFLPGLSQLTPI